MVIAQTHTFLFPLMTSSKVKRNQQYDGSTWMPLLPLEVFYIINCVCVCMCEKSKREESVCMSSGVMCNNWCGRYYLTGPFTYLLLLCITILVPAGFLFFSFSPTRLLPLDTHTSFSTTALFSLVHFLQL